MKHNLSKGLVDTLIIFSNLVNKSNKKEIHLLESGMTTNRINNFQKLRYFNLVYKGKESGYWGLTEFAIPFLKGELNARQYVVTFNNEVTRKSEERININCELKRKKMEKDEITIIEITLNVRLRA